ncbi:MAG: CvpA family protein [Parvibaculum sp.]|uniref:CvpA family protein n=1 Tax=Parvibaculum sp. TaxID=2024848 RepID=UPI00283EF740|nr:CvpA family protein [Parvibaculum sp.]MDR3500865.1 CvpA family protein [Parvibaculum sp.]
MTLFDGIVIAVLAISSVLALLRGFTNEVLSILAWVVGALAALWLFPYATPIFRSFIGTEWLAAVVAALAIFIVGYLLVAAFTMRWADHMLALFEQAETLDKTLGFLFGLVRGLLIVTVAYLFFAWLVPNPADQPDWIRNAKLRPLVESSAATLFTLAPSEPGRLLPHIPGNQARTPAPERQTVAPQPSPAANPPAETGAKSGADTAGTPGYNTSERRGLDRLFENTE